MYVVSLPQKEMCLSTPFQYRKQNKSLVKSNANLRWIPLFYFSMKQDSLPSGGAQRSSSFQTAGDFSSIQTESSRYSLGVCPFFSYITPVHHRSFYGVARKFQWKKISMEENFTRACCREMTRPVHEGSEAAANPRLTGCDMLLPCDASRTVH